MNLFTKQTQRHRKQTYAAKGQVGGVTNQEVWNKNIHTTIYAIDNQQGSTIQHWELYSLFYNNLYWKNSKKRISMSIYA